MCHILERVGNNLGSKDTLTLRAWTSRFRSREFGRSVSWGERHRSGNPRLFVDGRAARVYLGCPYVGTCGVLFVDGRAARVYLGRPYVGTWVDGAV